MLKMRKQYQRKLNKRIRDLNRNIANDNLWMGRFEFRQRDARFELFSDNSGGILHIKIRAYDKKTGYYKDYILEYAPWLSGFGWSLWQMANSFIVDACGVWSENPRPSLTNGFVMDYTKIHIPDWVMKEPDNYFINYRKDV